MAFTSTILHAAFAAALICAAAAPSTAAERAPASSASAAVADAPLPGQVRYRTVTLGNADVFYRDAGPATAPAVVLLHGFPTSSHMFRDLIPRLSDRYRVIAPDYPGFGYSSMPSSSVYPYTFANYARTVDALLTELGVSRYALYVMDYGAPVGFRLALAHPERVSALVVQNGNAYEEGLQEFWSKFAPITTYWRTGAAADREALRWLTSFKATHWQYTHGVPDASLVSPDAYRHDQAGLDRPGNADVQLDLFYDYRTNVPLYPEVQSFLRIRRPPTLIVWGKNDYIFPAVGAHAYLKDLPEARVHLFDAGHFLLETHGPQVAALIRDFLAGVPALATR